MSMTSCWLRLQTQKAAEIRYKCCGRTRGTSCGRNLCSPALKATLYMMKSICIRSWSVWMPASAAIGSVWSCWTPEAERRRCWTAAVSVKRWRIFLNHMAQGVRAYLLPRGRQWSILLNAATGSGIEQTVAELDALLKRAAREAGGDFLCAFSKPWRDFKTSILLIWRPTKRCANSMKKPPVVRNNAGRLCSRRRCRGFPVSRKSF